VTTGSTHQREWDPIEPTTLHSPQEAYALLRAQCPVAHTDRFDGFWGIFRHEDIVAAARDVETFISGHPSTGTIPSVANSMRIPLQSDPPQHTRFRARLRPYFTYSRMASLEPHVRAMASEMLAPLIANGGGDFIEELAFPFPARVLCTFLDIPPESWLFIKQITDELIRYAGNEDREGVARMDADLSAYSAALVADRRKHPRDPQEDLITGLLVEDRKGERMTDEAIAGIMLLLFIAGHETTTGGLGNCVAYLASDHRAQDELRSDPSLIPQAVEEMLRLDAPVQQLSRLATKDTDLCGRTIPAGDRVALMWISGCRDSEKFPEAAVYNPYRDTRDSIAFGFGIHHCLGAPLARLVLKVVLEELLEATTKFTVSGTSEKRTWPLNGYRSLPLAMEPSEQ
jgi:cytochrome P450